VTRCEPGGASVAALFISVNDFGNLRVTGGPGRERVRASAGNGYFKPFRDVRRELIRGKPAA
jgi:hypothetical protein